MRKIIPLIFSIFSAIGLMAQANGGWGNCEFTTVATMNAFDPSSSNYSCKKAYVQATDEHYYWDGSTWVQITDDQNASEVPFTPAGTISATNVQDAIEEAAAESLENIYTDDGSLEADRAVDLNGNDLTFEGTNDIVFESNGYVGIGTAPTSPLHIDADVSNTTGIIRVEGTEPDINFNDTNGGFTTFTFENAGIPQVAFGKNGSNDFYITRNSGSGWVDNAFVLERATGDVGIGTGNPAARLDVDGGGVKFSDYGTIATYDDASPLKILGVDADGDVVQTTTASIIGTDDQTATEVPFTPVGTIAATNVQTAIAEIEPDIYGSVGVHDDVDITTTAPSSGDVLAWDGSNFVPQETDNGYTIFNVFAEESAGLGNNAYEWSFGNGDETPNGHGIVIPVDCELFAMSLDHESSTVSNTTVQVIKNTDATLTTYQVTNTGVEQGYATFGTPLSFTAGDVVNFRTISSTQNGNSGRVSAWFRIRATPVSTSLVNDMLDVSAGAIASGDILHYNGSSYVPLTLNAANVPYDNATSGLTATDVKTAIDELAGAPSSNIYSTNGTLAADRTVTMGNQDLEFNSNGTGDFIVSDNGTDVLVVQDRDVGIGITNPNNTLHIREAGSGTAASSTEGSIYLEHASAGGTSSIVFKSSTSGNDFAYMQYSDDGSGNGSNTNNGLLEIAVEDDGTDASQDDIAIMPSGALGVGTISPDAFLDVEGGNVRFSDYGEGTYLDVADTLVAANATYTLAVDTNGDVIEMNTAKSSKIFYPPALIIDVSTTGNNRTLDLHQQYISLYGTPAIVSSGAPAAIPTYAEDELFYYVTDYDTDVFSDLKISAAGLLTYDVDMVPVGNCAVFNVVFVVK